MVKNCFADKSISQYNKTVTKFITFDLMLFRVFVMKESHLY
ncbi:hypothetical protein BTN49_0811 [Candidatus Enterovibrio escicola]|uniref:Uncharacterized protein n=1 Tax=Candidatus Enterovibrio escicola TaxID=1927127 RepID=A0A2A5T6W7_9GAMM|nr:hypothetical protein BTN49_0811 [Candidatus Enterovibrio escacola]